MKEALVSLLVTYFAYEAKVWFPKLIDGLIRLAGQRVPRKHRSRYIEEWRAHAAETPSAAKRLWDALGFSLASPKMFPAHYERLSAMKDCRRSASMNLVYNRLISFVMIAFLGPMMFGIAIAVLLTSPGPIFYRQPRLLPTNRVIYVLKFRTTHLTSEGFDPKDKLTPIGDFMRLTYLDELPALFNVLKGDMSIVVVSGRGKRKQ